MSVLAVTPERGAREFGAVSADKVAEPLLDPESVAVGVTKGDFRSFQARRARLLRWGWAEPEADALAERLVRRDRESDQRVSCTDCRHYRPGRCGNHRRARLDGAEVGRDLAALLQRCPGFDDAT